MLFLAIDFRAQHCSDLWKIFRKYFRWASSDSSSTFFVDYRLNFLPWFKLIIISIILSQMSREKGRKGCLIDFKLFTASSIKISRRHHLQSDCQSEPCLRTCFAMSTVGKREFVVDARWLSAVGWFPSDVCATLFFDSET